MSDEQADTINLADQEFVAFDTETTGLDATFHRVVELGAVKFHPGREHFERFAHLVNPGRPIPPEVIPIHGITDSMVAGAPSMTEILPLFLRFCGPDGILLAHNAPFDLSFLGAESRRTGLPMPELPVLDTVLIARVCFPGLPSYSLETLTKTLGLAPSQEHRALEDALLVQTLFRRALAARPDIDSRARLLAAFPPDFPSRYQGDRVVLPARLAEIQTAVDQKLRVEIEYASSTRPPEARIIRPFLLQTRSSVIYVTAFCELAGAERTFRADRILNLRIVGDSN